MYEQPGFSRQTNPADRGNSKIRTPFQTHDQDFCNSDQMLTVTDLMLLCKTKEATKSN